MKPVEITLFDDVLYDDGCSALAGKYAAFKLNKTTIFVDKSHVVQVKRWSRAHRGHPRIIPGLQSTVVLDYACSLSFNIHQKHYYL